MFHIVIAKIQIPCECPGVGGSESSRIATSDVKVTEDIRSNGGGTTSTQENDWMDDMFFTGSETAGTKLCRFVHRVAVYNAEIYLGEVG